MFKDKSKQVDVIGTIGVPPDSFHGEQMGYKNTDFKSFSNSLNETLDETGGEAEIIFHSPGGIVYDGYQMYNEILRQRENGADIKGLNNGLVASIASLLYAGTGKTYARNASSLMIHPVSKFVINRMDKKAVENMHEEFSVAEQTIAEEFSKLNGMPVELNKKLIEKTTWMSAKDSVDNNFTKDIIDGSPSDKKFLKNSYKSTGYFENASVNCVQTYFEEQKGISSYEDCNNTNQIINHYYGLSRKNS